MPLTSFQEIVARLVAQNRTEDSHLAGGAALHIAPNSKRYSNDLDYFHDSEERVATAFAQDKALLQGEGITVQVLLSQPGFVRAIASKGDEQTRIDWAHDTAWRFLPPVRHEVSGIQLHPIDLAINKLLALVGRDEPRDFLDTLEVHDSILPLGALIWATAGKDPGYTPDLLLDMLRRRDRYQQRDFDRLHLAEEVRVEELKVRWIRALEEAAAFVASRPAAEVGCLYYAASTGRFVGGHKEAAKAIPHYGRPGGVLPIQSLAE